MLWSLSYKTSKKMFTKKEILKHLVWIKMKTIIPFWLATTLVGITTYYLLLVQQGNYVKN